jgi:hypothetical protein
MRLSITFGYDLGHTFRCFPKQDGRVGSGRRSPLGPPARKWPVPPRGSLPLFGAASCRRDAGVDDCCFGREAALRRKRTGETRSRSPTQLVATCASPTGQIRRRRLRNPRLRLRTPSCKCSTACLMTGRLGGCGARLAESSANRCFSEEYAVSEQGCESTFRPHSGSPPRLEHFAAWPPNCARDAPSRM